MMGETDVLSSCMMSKRSRDRRRKTSMDNVKEDYEVRTHNMDIRDAIVSTRDRTTWTNIVQTRRQFNWWKRKKEVKIGQTIVSDRSVNASI